MNRRDFIHLIGKVSASLTLLIISKLRPNSQEDPIDGGDQGGYLVPPEDQKRIVEAIQREDVIAQSSVDMPAIDDIANMEAFICNEFRKEIDADIDNQFLTGYGIAKPIGILNDNSLPGPEPLYESLFDYSKFKEAFESYLRETEVL